MDSAPAIDDKSRVFKWRRVDRAHYLQSLEPCAIGPWGFIGYKKKVAH